MNRQAFSLFLAALIWQTTASPAGGAVKTVKSKHFAVIYTVGEATESHAKFIAQNLDRSWKRVFTDLGYKRPAWMKNNILIPVMIKDCGSLYAVATTWYSRATGKLVGGSIAIQPDKKFKDKNGKVRKEVVRATCAHEFFHLVQAGYDRRESKWLKETTATWIEDKVFPAEAKTHPKDYGYLFYLNVWNRHRGWRALTHVGSQHEYAASAFFQYIGEHDPRKEKFVRLLWEEAGKVKGDTAMKAFGALVKDNGAWGTNTFNRLSAVALADLVRSAKRRKKFSFAALENGPFPKTHWARFGGLVAPGERDGVILTARWNVEKLAFAHVELRPDAKKPTSGPFGVSVGMRGERDDDWAFFVIRGPKKGNWTVRRFPKPKAKKWVAVRIGQVDFATEKLFLTAVRRSKTSAARFHVAAMILAQPVVESFRVRMATGKGASEGKSPPMRTVWGVERLRTDYPTKTKWRSMISREKGIACGEEDEKVTFLVKCNRPVAGPLTLKLTDKMVIKLVAKDKSNRRFAGSVGTRKLEKALLGTTDEVRTPVLIEGKDALGMGLDGDPWTAPELVFKGVLPPKMTSIKNWEGGDKGSKKPGGKDRLGGKKLRIYKAIAAVPEVVAVKLSRAKGKKEIFYADPGGAFRPITPGPVKVFVAFNTPMDKKSGELKYGDTPIKGGWKSPRTWHGSFVVPEGQAFKSMKGFHTLSIQATTVTGVKLDADPDAPGEQPDTKHRFLVDGIPPFVKSVEVYGKGEKFYEAEWAGGARLKRAESLAAAKLDKKIRTLRIRRNDDLPAKGKGTIFISVRVSQPLPSAPSILVGGVTVKDITSEKNPKFWTGSFELADLRAKIKPGKPIPVEISAGDIYDNKLDADPRTVTAIGTKKPWWVSYEDKRGGPSTGLGGTDRWHELAVKPRISFVIVLDASGSMKDNNKLKNAKQAIGNLLNAALNDIELAVIVFYDQSNISSVGFTTDKEQIRKLVDSAKPQGATPLAASIAVARTLLETSSHPMSFDWRYKVFSDGQETCGGNVIAELRKLDEAIARRKGTAPKPRKDKIPPPRPTGPDAVKCNPQQWTTYRVKIKDRGSLDTIWLIEMTFTEKQLPDGRCDVSFKSTPYGIAYWGRKDTWDDDAKLVMKWLVNSRPDPSKVLKATSSDGLAAVDKVRRHAQKMKGQGKSMAACRAEIEQHVHRNLKEAAGDVH